MSGKIKKYKFLILVILLSGFSLINLIHSGFPITDDGNWMIIRLSAFYEALRSGQFPVRFLLRLNNGYGYPVSDFLYPLYLYLGSLIHIFGFNFTSSVKLVLGLSLLSSSIFSYYWLRTRFSEASSLIGALTYTYFPYHLYDIFVRGSVGEALAIALLPFVLWQLEKRNFLLTSLGISLLVLSHNSLAAFYIPVILVYGILINKKQIKFVYTSLVLGILGASFFWIPALYDTRFTVFNSIQVSQFSGYLNLNNLSYLGFIFLISIILSIYLIFKNRIRKDWFLIISIILSLVIVILLLPISKNLWEIIPFKGLIQFPFRLISLIILFSAFQVAFIFEKFNKHKFLIAAVFIVFIVISSLPFITNLKFEEYPDSYYSTNLATTTVKNEYMPLWVKEIPDSYPNERVKITGNEKIYTSLITSNKVNFQVYLTKKDIATINIIYFPGWKASVNGKSQEINYYNNRGLITLNLDKGDNNVKLWFSETPLRLFSDIISIIGIILVILMYILIKSKKLKPL